MRQFTSRKREGGKRTKSLSLEGDRGERYSNKQCSQRKNLSAVHLVQIFLRRAIFAFQLVDKFGHRLHGFNGAYSLAGAPYILPRLGLAVATGSEVHGRNIALGQVIGVHTGAFD